MPHLPALQKFLDDADSDEVSAAFLVARLLDDVADLTSAERILDDLGERFVRDHRPSASELCAFLTAEGFEGAADYYQLDNSRLDQVLRNRRGIPITLAMVHLAVARAGSLDAHGLNVPGHFLVAVGNDFIDPFDVRVLRQDERASRLGGSNPSQLERATPLGVALRMLNNVRAILASRGDYVGVLTMLDHQLVLSPSSVELHLARAEVWERLGSRDSARAALLDAKRYANDELNAHIDSVLSRLGKRGPVVH